jgi:hypothetical protein
MFRKLSFHNATHLTSGVIFGTHARTKPQPTPGDQRTDSACPATPESGRYAAVRRHRPGLASATDRVSRVIWDLDKPVTLHR